MNRIEIKYFILIIFIFNSFRTKSQPIVDSNYYWEIVPELTDEFNETVLDKQKWFNYLPYWSGREPSQFDTNNVTVSEGCLRLKSTVSNYNQTGNWIASSCVTSKTKAMRPGYYSEAKIKCPKLSMTGAFWFQGLYSEIDVIENFGAPTAAKYAGYETYMNTNTHYFVGGFVNDKYTQWSASILQPSCADTFFTYGVWWKDPATIIFFLNGQEIHTSKPAGSFNENMYMFFDMEAFSWGIGLPTIESLDDSTRNTQYVDWVRTFKLVPKSNSTLVPDILNTDNCSYLYPNPTSAGFRINQEEKIQLEIYTIKGILVLRKQIIGKESIPTSNLPAGLYFVKIINGNSTSTRRLIINRNT
jgi:hypothetical protein